MKLQITPPSPSSCLLLCFTPPLFSTAAARGRLQGHLLLLSFPTRRARALTAAFASRRVLFSPCHAAPSARRPPPRRRRGKPKSEPRPSFSCAQEHYKYPSKLILSLFRFFPHSDAPKHLRRPSISTAARARTRSHPSATARPKPNPSAPSSCFTGPPRPDPLHCSSPEHRLRRSSSPPIAGARGASASGHPEPRHQCPEVRLDLLFLFPHLWLAVGDLRRRDPAPPPLFPFPNPAKGLCVRVQNFPGTYL